MRPVAVFGWWVRNDATRGATSTVGGAALRRHGSTLVTVAIGYQPTGRPLQSFGPSGGLVVEEGHELAVAEPVAAVQEGQLDQERQAHHLSPELLDEPDGRF